MTTNLYAGWGREHKPVIVAVLTPRKQCDQCERFRDRSEFYKHPSGRGGILSRCKKCFNANEKFRRLNPVDPDAWQDEE